VAPLISNRQQARVRGIAQRYADEGHHGTLDADGRFSFPRLPPVPSYATVSFWRDEKLGFGSKQSIPLDLKPGQPFELNLGGGTTVKGKVKLTGRVPAGLDCSSFQNYLVRLGPGIPPPRELAALGFEARKAWLGEWSKSTEGYMYMYTLPHWFVTLSPAGAFRISGVPPGEYEFIIAAYIWQTLSFGVDVSDRRVPKVVRITVTDADVARGEVVLPEIAVDVAPSPAVGEVPSVAFERADGKAASLAELRGSYALVHFWADGIEQCAAQLPALRRLHQRYGGKLAMLGLSVEKDAAGWRAELKRLDLPWQQGRLASQSEAVFHFLPEYWLVDPTGKIVVKDYDQIDKITAAVDEAMAK
jgi:thiol-disulfide isomerase/thioredoxin